MPLNLGLELLNTNAIVQPGVDPLDMGLMPVAKRVLPAVMVLLALLAASDKPAVAAGRSKRHPRTSLATPPASMTHNWSGFYVGLNAGAAWGFYGAQTSTNSDSAIGGGAVSVNAAGNQIVRPLGFSGGPQAGYNWQWGNWVTGIETDLSYLHLNGAAASYVSLVPASTATAVINAYGSVNWMATARPRVGWTSGNWLFYATGGLAVTDLNDEFALSRVTATGTATYEQSSHLGNLAFGYALGGGVETTIADRWSVKAEYLHVGFGRSIASQTATSDPAQLTVQSASLSSDIFRVGLDYHVAGNAERAADADSAWAAPIKTTTLISPLLDRSNWQFDVGTRTWWGSGAIGAPQPLLSSSQALISRLTWTDLDALTGETYGRLDHVSGWFVKGFLGAGGIYNGQMNDEDFPGASGGGRLIGVAYSNTHSSSSGNLDYADIDVGYSFLRAPGAKMGAFVGYNYYAQQANAFGCTQLAASTNCSGFPPNYLGISEYDHFNALRIGFSSEYMLTNRLKFTAEAAYLPAVEFGGLDYHNARPFFADEGASAGDGVMLEALLNYSVTSFWNIGVGARYWSWNTYNGTSTQTFTNGELSPGPQPARFSTERYGVFLQSGYHWGDTASLRNDTAQISAKVSPGVAGQVNWSGFYIGGHLGGGWSDAHWSDPFGAPAPAGHRLLSAVNVPYFGDMTHATGPLGGGQIGADWQTGHWVIGGEADGSAADLRGDNTCFSGLGGINCEHVVKDVSTISGRAGYAWNRALFYAKGGGAWASTTYNLNGNTGAIALGTGSTAAIESGWEAGVGLEYALTAHWSTGFEYDHIDLNRLTVPFPTVALVDAQDISVRQSLDVFKLDLNYRFGWPAQAMTTN